MTQPPSTSANSDPRGHGSTPEQPKQPSATTLLSDSESPSHLIPKKHPMTKLANTRSPLRRSRSLQLAILASLTGSVVVANSAVADPLPAGCQGPECSSFQIEDTPITKAPTRFKFQTRISQAKLPVGDALFDDVTVQLLDGNQLKCEESHKNVRVLDSVLNLEIGGGWAETGNCQLDEIMAGAAGLNFRVCIGDQNCLKPIALSSVPYALKANFAVQTQEAHRADVAAQAHYAHRMTADTSLFIRSQQGSGYYDFHTPTSTDTLSWDAQSVADASSVGGGFIQWTPVNNEHKKLHLCAKDPGTNNLVDLDSLLFHAAKTIAKGEFHVTKNATVGTTLDVGTSLTVGEDATIARDTSVGNFLVVGANAISASVEGTGARVIGGLTITDDPTNELPPEAGKTTTENLQVNHFSTLVDGLLASGASTFSQGGVTISNAGLALTVNGQTNAFGNVDIDGNVDIRDHVSYVAGPMAERSRSRRAVRDEVLERS